MPRPEPWTCEGGDLTRETDFHRQAVKALDREGLCLTVLWPRAPSRVPARGGQGDGALGKTGRRAEAGAAQPWTTGHLLPRAAGRGRRDPPGASGRPGHPTLSFRSPERRQTHFYCFKPQSFGNLLHQPQELKTLTPPQNPQSAACSRPGLTLGDSLAPGPSLHTQPVILGHRQ